MSIVRLLGSFPNSQIKPTSAVRETDVDVVPVGASPVETKILDANEDRISITFKNEGTFPLKYDTEPGNVASEGILIQPQRTFTVEGPDVEVWASGIGGATEVSFQDERG